MAGHRDEIGPRNAPPEANGTSAPTKSATTSISRSETFRGIRGESHLKGYVSTWRYLYEDPRFLALSPGRRYVYRAYLDMANWDHRVRGYLIDSYGKPYGVRELARLIGIDDGGLTRTNRVLMATGLLRQNGHGWLQVIGYDEFVVQNAEVELRNLDPTCIPPDESAPGGAQRYSRHASKQAGEDIPRRR